MSKQLGNMLGIQAHESKTDQELAEKGGRKNTKEARKRHEAHIAKQNGENAEQLWLNKKKQEVVATVANNQRERLEEDVEVQSKLFSQDQGTQDVLVSSYKSAMKYSGDGEELTHRENGVRASGEEPEVEFFCIHQLLQYPFRQGYPNLLRRWRSSLWSGCWCRWSSASSATGPPHPRRSCRSTLQGITQTI